MTARWPPPRLIAASLFAAAIFASAPRGMTAEPVQIAPVETAPVEITPVEAALALSLEAPARLVLAYWPSGGWLVRQSGRQVEIVFPGARLAISTDAVQLPAGAGVIAAVDTEIAEDATYLRFSLGCGCTLAVQGDGRQLLIDVIGADRITMPADRAAAAAPRLAPVPPPRHRQIVVATGANDGRRVEETRSRLLEELRRAAETGLVTLRPDAGGVLAGVNELAPVPEKLAEPERRVAVEDPGEKQPESADSKTQPNGAQPGETDPGEGNPGETGRSETVAHAAAPEQPALAETGAPDRPAGSHPLPGATQSVESAPLAAPAPPHERHSDLVAVSPAPTCFGSAAFGLADPLRPGAFSAEISRLRRALIGEFDRVDLPSALSLARLYLAHGLGFEALGTLAEFAPDAPEAGLLAAIAWLVEGKPLPVPNILQVAGCTGQHALWQAVDAALAERPAEALEHESAAAGALEQTARGLRGQIAARLGLAATAEHDWIAAHRLNAMAKRAVAKDDRDGREMRLLLEAQLERGRGNLATTLERLKELRGARSPAGAEALMMLGELAADPANGAGVRSDQLRLDLGALAMVQRDAPLGERAFLGEAELTGHLFGRDAAFELLAYGFAGRILNEAAYREALATVGASVPERPDDTPLALAYEADPQRFNPTLEDRRFRLALARSYSGLGAPALAEAVLRPGDLQGDALLGDLARSYLEIGNSEAAERFAARLPEGPGRATIVAGAALARGDAPAALVALNAAGAPAALRARTAWAAGDWPASVEALSEAAAAPGSRAGADQPTAASLPEPGDAMPPAQLAARLALAARRAGRGAVPPEAASLAASLAATEPGLEAGLQAILAPAAGNLTNASQAEVAAYLETIAAEARLLEELLEDG